jgi:hypothetical protein
MYIFELGIEFTFAIPLNEKQKEIYGESKARDLQLNILSKKWGLDMYLKKYSGFYLTDPDVVIPPNIPFPQRVDISTRNIGVTGNYVFNNKKFSFRSAYNYAERQMRSAGSFLLFSSINGFTARGDSALLSKSYQTVFDTDTEIREIKSTTFGIAPGYTYSFIHKGFFINATLALGPAHNWLSYVKETGQRKHDIEFTAITVARVALGYNGDRFFGGLSYVRQGSRARFDTIELSSFTGTFRILFGFRFKEVEFMKYRVGDIPKALGL